MNLSNKNFVIIDRKLYTYRNYIVGRGGESMKKKWILAFFIITISVFLNGCRYQEATTSPLAVNTIYLYMEEEDIEELYGRDPLSDDRVKGIVKLSPEDEDLKTVELRFRGDSTRYLPKKSFNIRFEQEQDFIFGSDRMNLNASYTDPTFMREKLAMDMFHELGLPAPRTVYFNLYINDIYEGLYLHVERIDKNLLEYLQVNKDGTLVRDGFTRNLMKEEIDRASLFGYDIASVGEQAVLLEENFEYRGTPNWEAVIDLAKWVYDTPEGEDFYKGLEEYFYLDRFVDWVAIHLLVGDIDSFADDYWLYKNHEDPSSKWMLIAWDKDLTFGSTFRDEEYVDNDYFAYEYDLYKHGYRDNDMIAKFLRTPQLRQKLFDRMSILMEEVFTPQYFEDRIKTIRKAIEESATALPGEDAFLLHLQNHHGELNRYQYHLETLLDFIELRYEFLKRQIHEIEDQPYVAKTEVSSYKKGDTVFFTDASGWTIAKLYIKEIITAGPISLRVDKKEKMKGINRIWTVDARHSEMVGDLTLYYRNDVSGFGRSNWYEEAAALGKQWSLSISQYKDGVIQSLPSRINPYSNKVTAEITLKNIMQLVVTY